MIDAVDSLLQIHVNSGLLYRKSSHMQRACVPLKCDMTFPRAEPHKPALILRNPINYISLRIICVGNALVRLYQEMIVVYFTFDLFCFGDRLLLGDETYVWASTRRSGTDQF
jgi:hypothetical protein